jgi:hypothetical protein
MTSVLPQHPVNGLLISSHLVRSYYRGDDYNLIRILVRYVPSWFPGAEFKRVAKRYRAKLERFINEPHEWVKSQMVLITR